MLKLIGSTLLMAIYLFTVILILIFYAFKMLIDAILSEVVTVFAKLSCKTRQYQIVTSVGCDASQGC